MLESLRAVAAWLPALGAIIALSWLWPAGLSGAPGSTELLRARAAASPKMLPWIERLSPAAHEAWDDACAQSDAIGRMPSIQDFLKVLETPTARLTKDDFTQLQWIFARLQRPSVDANALRELLTARAHSIETLDCRYRASISGGSNDGWSHDVRFAIDGSKMYLWRDSESSKGERILNVVGYDGELLAMYSREGEERLAPILAPDASVNAEILPFDSAARFLDEMNPLFLQKVFDFKSRFDFGTESDDLTQVVAEGVYETSVDFHGVECVVAGVPQMLHYLAPEFGYSLVGVEKFVYDFDSKRGAVTRQGDYSRTVIASDFISEAPDLWLARNIEVTVRRAKSPNEVQTIAVQAYNVNDPIPATLFSDIIPPNAYVADRTLGAMYVEGGDRSVQAAIDREVRPPARRRWILWINAAAIVALAAVFLLRRFRKAA